MAIFERIGKSVTDVGQGIAQQTRDFAEVNRINSLITDMKRRETTLFGEIGQAYYEKHRDDVEPEFSAQLSELREMEVQLEMWSDQIKQIQGFTKCRSCRADIPRGAQFCSICGMKIEDSRCCPNCGKPVLEGVRFCVSCGTKLQEAEPPMAVPPKYSVREKCCPICGTCMSEQDHFCPECGAEVLE